MKKQQLLTAVLLLCTGVCVGTGCSSSDIAQGENTPQVLEESVSEAAAKSGLPAVGEEIGGFVVSETGTISALGAETVLFKHEQSGAELFYISNDDENRSFSISYKTPHVDETDTNHIFEHAIIASSDKYPSTDLFFDLANKSYSTYINAGTSLAFTMYPAASQSEEQLLKLADAYLSCMVAPGVMEDENFFKREALRYELEDKDSPITMQGTVFSEDVGYMTSMDRAGCSSVLKALYPGTTASNVNAQLYKTYPDLTYEKMKATYNRCYHFDNSLMILYGKLDYRQFLEFIDEEYLSKVQRNNTDLSAYMNEPVPEGYTEQRVEIPAYEGDAAEQATTIYYAIDLSTASWDDIFQWSLVSDMLNYDNSPLQKYAREEGITRQIEVAVLTEAVKPYLFFSLSNTDEDEKEALKRSVGRALEELSDHGISKDVYDTVLKKYELDKYLSRNDTFICESVSGTIATYWVHTGKTSYFSDIDIWAEKYEADKEQELLKELAKKAAAPYRSACVVTVPTPGLAEKLEQEREDYLADMKASMTDEQIEQMIADTKAFRAWNENEVRNNDVGIAVKDLPEPNIFTGFEKKDIDGITSYTATVDVDKVGSSAVYFDIRNIQKEDLYYLPIYHCLIGRMDTASHTVEELENLKQEYLYGLGRQENYPKDEAGANARPMSNISWYAMTEDYETSLKLLLELLGETDFSDTERAVEILERYVPYYDQSRYTDRMQLAQYEALAYINRSQAFYDSVNSQEQYQFMREVLRRLKEDGYGQEFKEKMEEISNCFLNRRNMIVVNIASSQALDGMEKTAQKILGALPVKESQDQDYGDMLTRRRTRGIGVEAANQCIGRMGEIDGFVGVSGQDLSFLMALQDLYIVPRLRFQLGAYSAGSTFSLYSNYLGFYSFSDPNVGVTMDVYDGAGEYLRTADILQDELDSYILNAYAAATAPMGMFTQRQQEIWMDIKGADRDMVMNKIREIKETTIEDQTQAANRLEEALRRGGTVVVGNQTDIEADSDRFDEVIDYRK